MEQDQRETDRDTGEGDDDGNHPVILLVEGLLELTQLIKSCQLLHLHPAGGRFLGAVVVEYNGHGDDNQEEHQDW
jgi:hypothetical protein